MSALSGLLCSLSQVESNASYPVDLPAVVRLSRTCCLPKGWYKFDPLSYLSWPCSDVTALHCTMSPRHMLLSALDRARGCQALRTSRDLFTWGFGLTPKAAQVEVRAPTNTLG